MLTRLTRVLGLPRKTAALLVAAFPLAGPGLGAEPGKRPFTVRDAIEVSRFVNPSISEEGFPTPEPIVSPDGKWFLLVTERGLLSENRIEDTLWAFDREAFIAWARHPASRRPEPRAIACLSASVDVPVIAGVRWLPGSRSVAFVGKDGSPYPRLYLADVAAGRATAVTAEDAYVTAYDVLGDTIAYTAMSLDFVRSPRQERLVSAIGKKISDLLYPEPPSLNSPEETLAYRPAALHVRRGGRETPVVFELAGMPLRLFPPSASLSPPLSLSPDGRFLVTLSPVSSFDPSWAEYQPRREMGLSGWDARDPSLLADDNYYKPMQYVLVNLETGKAAPLIHAPLARELGYFNPSAIFWIDGGRRVILGNTFLPIDPSLDAAERKRRTETPAIVSVDISTRAWETVAMLETPGFHSEHFFDVDDVRWDPKRETITLLFTKHADRGAPPPQVYARRGGRWAAAAEPARRSDEDVRWRVAEACDRSPVLVATHDREESVAWDPNPQLREIALGPVSVYHWTAADGRNWSGLLALPPDFDPSKRYPVVFQTHGYRADRFFTDGVFTTGSAGRALVARGVVVVQMDIPYTYTYKPEDAPLQLRGFESAVAKLTADGIADPKRIGVIGFSFTCYHVLHALTHDPDLFAAAAITDGVVMSYMQYVLSEGDDVRYHAFETTMGGTPWGPGLSTWIERSPTLHLDKVRAPVLINALERGALLSMWDPYAALRRLRKPVDLLWLETESAPHVLVRPRHRYLSQQSAVDWFDFWLNGREDPGPEKAAQYARWRELRPGP